MKWWVRRVGIGLIALTIIVLSFTFIYQWGMLYFEGQERTIYNSLQKVVEILTTAGFGGDTEHWTTLGMNLIVISMNLTAVLLVFIGIPLYIIPLLQRAFEEKIKQSTELTDHVVICSYSPTDEVLSEELSNSDIPYLFIEEEKEKAEKLVDRGEEAIFGNPAEVETLRSANLEEARAVVTDVSDAKNPTIVLSARKVNPKIKIISMTREVGKKQYHMLAGADYVVESRKVLGKSLANRALSSAAEKFSEAIKVDTKLKIAELLVEENSPAIDMEIKEFEQSIEKETTVIGIWSGGKFTVSPDPKTKIKENSILLVATKTLYFPKLQVRQIKSYHQKSNKILVCGHGTVGPSATKPLKEQGLDVKIVDIEEKEGVDIVGDVTDLDLYKKIDLKKYRSVILTIDDDATAVYATLIIKNIAPSVEIIARANTPESVWKLYNAGADFVLALPNVAGEILASLIIEDRTIITPKTKLEFCRIQNDELAGKTIAELDIRNKTGATIVAIEREGKLITRIRGNFQLQEKDTMIGVGNKRNIKKLKNLANKQ